MTITIGSELAARLREDAARKGQQIDRVAEDLLRAKLDEEEQERVEAVAGIQRGLDAAAAGRVRPLSAFLEEERARVGITRDH